MKTVFKAVFENGVILEWGAPQTWRNVFSSFKLFGKYEESKGALYCVQNGAEYLIRETGKGDPEYV